jgi:protein gp37
MKQYGKDFRLVKQSGVQTFMAPYRWKEPLKIFTCSWGDFFHPAADEWRADAWEVIRNNDRHTWLILTKRPELVTERLPWDWGSEWPNVWIGTSLENGSTKCTSRLNALLKIPAAHRFVSCEPLLGPVDMGKMVEPSEEALAWADNFKDEFIREYKSGFDDPAAEMGDQDIQLMLESWQVSQRETAGERDLKVGLDWVIAGGESGPLARQVNPEWVRHLELECDQAKIPFFFKGWGEWLPEMPESDNFSFVHQETVNWKRVGREAAGRLLDRKEWIETPW